MIYYVFPLKMFIITSGTLLPVDGNITQWTNSAWSLYYHIIKRVKIERENIHSCIKLVTFIKYSV